MKAGPSLIIGLLACTAAHGAVSFIGVETDTAATGWADPSAMKDYAAKDDVYGSSGYYVLAPGGEQGTTSTPVVGNNIAGPKNQPASPTLISRPAALAADPKVVNGSWVNFPGYALISQPDSKAGEFRAGGISSDTVEGGKVGAYKDFIFFSVKPGASVRLGILVDAFKDPAYAADAISVCEVATGAVVYSETLSRDGVPDLVVFDLTNLSVNEAQYNIALHTQIPALTGFSLLTFDPIP